jgi:hypothetical protein
MPQVHPAKIRADVTALVASSMLLREGAAKFRARGASPLACVDVQPTGHGGMAASAAAGFPERMTPMAEDDKSATGAVAHLVQEFTGQLRAITETLEDLAGFSGGHPLAPGALPLPGSFSAAQMTAVADSIATQRRSDAASRRCKPSCPPSTSSLPSWSNSSVRSRNGAGRGRILNSGCCTWAAGRRPGSRPPLRVPRI